MADGSDFEFAANSAPVSAEDRAAMLTEPGFGRVFTDHMASAEWTEGRGWHSARVMPRGPLSLDPAAAVLHYAQEIFEGLKAYRTETGDTVLFRPDANAARFRKSAERLAMPMVSDDLFIGAIEALVKADRDWFPAGPEGALYLRPFMFASEAFLGVRPAKEYRFLVLASSVAGYFKGAPKAITIGVSRNLNRAGPGGTGAAKCGGNYAASLVAQAEAIEHGCDQVVFLDAVEHRFVEELGGMNTFFVFDDGSILTPPLDGTILPGITRDSLMTLARDEGVVVREERYAIDQWQADAASGRLRESFACGTAAVVTSIGKVVDGDTSFIIGDGGPGPVTQALRERLVAIQRGQSNDPHGWLKRLF
ncbi:Branched-chain-amino-acid aminotransferase [Sphingomonas antarctica]|uniref:branched-chain amino acid aminotransferase n=1 Tax=Sphingomonas antarctica TaxID=2040274 RepID=UPI0039E9D296